MNHKEVSFSEKVVPAGDVDSGGQLGGFIMSSHSQRVSTLWGTSSYRVMRSFILRTKMFDNVAEMKFEYEKVIASDHESITEDI
jgi:hypothetical protein